MASYRKADTAGKSHHAHKLVRLLTKVAAANEIGPEACWLLALIAHQEDARRYNGPVSFWNDQLAPVAGCRGRSRLVRARDRAVRAGWLRYEPGGKGRPGRYETMIPPQYANIPDGPADEGDEGAICRPESGRQSDGNRTAIGRQPDGKRASFFPPPNPTPSPPNPPAPDGAAEDGWAAAGGELRECGVKNRRAALEAAQTAGLGPEHVTALCRVYRLHPGAWGPGALLHRLREATPPEPDEDLAEWAIEGWPTVSAQYADKQAEARRRDEARAERQERQAEVDADAALERDFGPALDALNQAERDELAEKHLTGAALQHYRRRGMSATIRATLLGALAAEAEEGSP